MSAKKAADRTMSCTPIDFNYKTRGGAAKENRNLPEGTCPGGPTRYIASGGPPQ